MEELRLTLLMRMRLITIRLRKSVVFKLRKDLRRFCQGNIESLCLCIIPLPL
jgi:hypothetical protein